MTDVVDILIVDDHPENLVALEGILQRPDYHIVKALSGAEALRSVLKHDFAVILLDVMMPLLDGFETARLIRDREASRAIPILFLTANTSEVSFIYKAYAVGAVDYLIKPIDANVVRAKVSVFVELYRKTRQVKRQEEQLREAERRRGEQALKESEALYQATFHDAAVGIAHATSQGRWLRMNPRFCEILGRTPEELAGASVEDVLHPEERAAFVPPSPDPHAFEGSSRETRFLHRDGRTVWVNLTLSVLRDASYAVRTLIVVIEDITLRKDADRRQRFLAGVSETLLRSLDQQRSTLEAVLERAVAEVADFCVLDLAEDDRGHAHEVLVACREPSLCPAVDELAERLRRGVGADGLRPLFQTTSPELVTALDEPELCARLSDPEARRLMREAGWGGLCRVPISVRQTTLGTLTLGARGAAFGPADLAMANDLAQRIAFALDNARLYQQARTAVSLREEFLSIASHELRTPLTPLTLQVQKLMQAVDRDRLDRIGPTKLRESLSACDRQVNRLTTLVDSLLDVSRISVGALTLQLELVDLTEIAREVVSRFSEEATRAGCTFALSADEPVVGRWDRMRVEQLVTNLVSNALKYGRGKPVELAVEGTLEAGRLIVRDHGIGIDPTRLARIFDRFERAASTSYGGLGLGLYIARQIVSAHGGNIGVESQPQRGSQFTVELPIGSASAPS